MLESATVHKAPREKTVFLNRYGKKKGTQRKGKLNTSVAQSGETTQEGHKGVCRRPKGGGANSGGSGGRNVQKNGNVKDSENAQLNRAK